MSMPFFLIPVLALIAPLLKVDKPLDLGRAFAKGEKLGYQIRSHITAEERFKGLDTWIPSDLDLNYNFTTTVTDMKADGVAVMHYLRPSMTEIKGETFNAGPETKIRNVDLDFILSVSPINAVLEEKDISKHPKHGNEGGGDGIRLATRQGAQSFFEPYIGDIHRLALFIGGVDDSLDFSPKLPFSPVKVGDTWKATVGFEPQKLKGKDGKTAVQRLDYVYTYLGPTDVDGRKVLRIEAKLKFSTDLAEFFKQLLQERASETNVDKVPLHFDSTIEFDLDPATHDTLRATGQTQGGYQVFLTETGSDPIQEERFKGKTVMELVGKRILPKS